MRATAPTLAWEYGVTANLHHHQDKAEGGDKCLSSPGERLGSNVCTIDRRNQSDQTRGLVGTTACSTQVTMTAKVPATLLLQRLAFDTK